MTNWARTLKWNRGADGNIDFISFPIEDRSVPTCSAGFDVLVEKMVRYSKASKPVVVHWRAGIGRSSLMATSILLRLGMSLDSVFRSIGKARGSLLPDTGEQRNWVELWIAGKGLDAEPSLSRHPIQ
jgi:protein-tyrosine phosphatase